MEVLRQDVGRLQWSLSAKLNQSPELRGAVIELSAGTYSLGGTE